MHAHAIDSTRHRRSPGGAKTPGGFSDYDSSYFSSPVALRAGRGHLYAGRVSVRSVRFRRGSAFRCRCCFDLPGPRPMPDRACSCVRVPVSIGSRTVRLRSDPPWRRWKPSLLRLPRRAPTPDAEPRTGAGTQALWIFGLRPEFEIPFSAFRFSRTLNPRASCRERSRGGGQGTSAHAAHPCTRSLQNSCTPVLPSLKRKRNATRHDTELDDATRRDAMRRDAAQQAAAHHMTRRGMMPCDVPSRHVLSCRVPVPSCHAMRVAWCSVTRRGAAWLPWRGAACSFAARSLHCSWALFSIG